MKQGNNEILNKYLYKLLFLISGTLFFLLSSCTHSPTSPSTFPNMDTLNLTMDIVNGNYELAWSSPLNSSIKYNIYRRTEDSKLWTKVGSVIGNKWDDSSIVNLNGYFLYEYSLTYSYGSSDESKMSKPLSVYTVTDNFNDNINRWVDPSDTEGLKNVTVSNGEMLVNCEPNTHFTVFKQADSWENLTFVVDAKSAQDEGSNSVYNYGVNIRCTSDDSTWAFYEFDFTNNVDRWLGLYNGNWVYGPAGYINRNINQWHTIKVKVNGNFFNGYFDDKPDINCDPSRLEFANSAPLVHGGVGMSTQGGVSVFDNVKVLITSWDTTLSGMSKISNLKEFAKYGLSIPAVAPVKH